MRINLNTKKKQKTIKKLTNNTKNNFNLKLKTNNNIIINPYIKWSRCNTNIIRSIKKGNFDKKESSSLNLYLNNLAMIEKHFKVKHHSVKTENHSNSNEIVKRELLNKDLRILNKLDNDIDESINPKNLNNIEDRHSTNDDDDDDDDNNIKIIDKEKIEKDKELKEEERLKMKKIQEEENMKKLKKCYSNSPYPTIINQEDKFSVNQIPSEILIRIFSNPIFNQNDYYKFCLVCRSWNQAATIVLWNKPYIHSFRQLVKFYQSILYNDEILRLNQEEVQTQLPPIQSFLAKTTVATINSNNNKYKYINHNLSKLVNKLDLTRVRLERPISTRQRTELYKSLNILGDKLLPFLNSLSICREQCNSYLFLGTSIVHSNEDYSNQALIPSINGKDHLSDTDLCFKEITYPLVHHLKFIDLNYRSVTTLLRCLKKFNQIETLHISIALFQSWKEWNNNNHHNNYLVFQKVIENLKSPHLKKIRFQNCCDLNDQACHTLFSKCKEITELEIFGSSNVSIDVLYYSLKMLKYLKILSYSAISTPQFKLGDEEEEEEERNIDNNNRNNNNNDNDKKKGVYSIDFSHKPCASKIQIIDLNSTGWSPYLNWIFHNQCGDSIKKLILTIQTEEERDTIYKAVSSCRSLEEIILNYRHESTENNDAPINNEQLSIDLDKLFLIKTQDYQSKIKFLYISGLEIENSKRLTKYIENLKTENNEEKEAKKEEENFSELSENLKFEQLKYLHLYLPSTKCPIEYILYQFPGLEEFVLNLNCKSLTEDCLCNIVETLKGKLISMRLERVNRSTITNKFLSCICQNNPSIQQLEIFAEHGKLDVTYEGTNNVIENCKNLRYFSLGLEGFNPIIPNNLEQPSNYRSYFKILNYTSKKKFI
ncbi:hypothetical protein H8356DRAFT_1086439 [Neocallimastix lanati (nom. inval.)]|uniref:F-box domain-containing protein n=1 Tax=Neocallimastix californiae TaxID=1754190 RepID=A0A1Y2C0P2_9FUNG|nr:hypothetical protein H8356DRAFT_1086439 [Neocallimastix sp. JGI-2020a]ORY40589.1 hypothetical protein LY90DRAFT_672170 [Neocallimastix californiae]|eukprot:ORY40589.1 hypothetical protein LY90DRAFT_672170 [Neocallimastix californiae]